MTQYTWFFIIPPITVAIIAFSAWYRYRMNRNKRDIKKVAVVSHTHVVRELPAYRAALRRYRALMAAAVVLFSATLFTFIAAAARPIAPQPVETNHDKRDVVLCLDVSGSMDSYSKQIVDSFIKIIDSFDGQRIGITIFDKIPATILPLSDDYTTVGEILNELQNNYSIYKQSVGDATLSPSMIGEGVMGCIESFDKISDESRSQSVIIATDNIAMSTDSIDIDQVARYASRYGITFYGIAPEISFSNEGVDLQKFQNAVVNITGGTFHKIKNDDSRNEEVVGEIVKNFINLEAEKTEGAPEFVWADTPQIMLIASAICFTGFVIVLWRLRI